MALKSLLPSPLSTRDASERVLSQWFIPALPGCFLEWNALILYYSQPTLFSGITASNRDSKKMPANQTKQPFTVRQRWYHPWSPEVWKWSSSAFLRGSCIRMTKNLSSCGCNWNTAGFKKQELQMDCKNEWEQLRKPARGAENCQPQGIQHHTKAGSCVARTNATREVSCVFRQFISGRQLRCNPSWSQAFPGKKYTECTGDYLPYSKKSQLIHTDANYQPVQELTVQAL